MTRSESWPVKNTLINTHIRELILLPAKHAVHNYIIYIKKTWKILWKKEKGFLLLPQCFKIYSIIDTSYLESGSILLLQYFQKHLLKMHLSVLKGKDSPPTWRWDFQRRILSLLGSTINYMNVY